MTVREFKAGELQGWHHASGRYAVARVFLVHGVCEHSGRHHNTIAQWLEHGYDCVRFDLRGHGLSGGRRQWVEAFDDYLDDLQAILRWGEQHLPQAPVFLYGHSLGGAICLRFAARRSSVVAGLMVNAPAFQIGAGVSPLRRMLARSLNFFAPRLSLPANLDISAISRDEQEVERAVRDPLSCQFNTVRQGYQILRALPQLPGDVARLSQPILFTHGKRDRLVDWNGTEELFTLCGSPDKERVYFDEGFHELHNDLDREALFRCLTDWLARHRAPR